MNSINQLSFLKASLAIVKIRRGAFSFLFLIIILALLAGTNDGNLFAASRSMVRAKHAMVVCADRRAADAGIAILKQGGNAIDAAVAVGFALDVVFPEAGNIGGGGFMLVRQHDGYSEVIDFRERAPKKSSRTMYLDSAGNATDKSVNGQLSVAVPGTVSGFAKALTEFGTMKLKDAIQPAIELAEQGIVVNQHLANSFESYNNELHLYPSTVKVFTKNGNLYVEGDTLWQPDLVATLKRIQKNGEDEFYRGETARLIVKEMERGGGILSEKDLKGYETIIRKPMSGSYRGYNIISAPLPSSGGTCLLELLNLVEAYDMKSMGFHSSRSVHVMTEAMKLVFADRAEYMGDPQFIRKPAFSFTSQEYIGKRRKELDTIRATPGEKIRHGDVRSREGNNTTHFVVIDEEGNIAAVTYTLNDLFGSKVVVDGAGFFLNDEMDDFSIKPGAPNLYGLIGGEANAIEPEKRPLSSMAPTIVLKDGKPIMVLGARGGSRIITAVFQSIVNVVDFGMNMQEAIDAPRFHHQWLPDTLIYEKFGFAEDVLQNLRGKGHNLLEIENSLGQLETLYIDSEHGWMYGAPDPREGGVAVGY